MVSIVELVGGGGRKKKKDRLRLDGAVVLELIPKLFGSIAREASRDIQVDNTAIQSDGLDEYFNICVLFFRLDKKIKGSRREDKHLRSWSCLRDPAYGCFCLLFSVLPLSMLIRSGYEK